VRNTTPNRMTTATFQSVNINVNIRNVKPLTTKISSRGAAGIQVNCGEH